ncbi:DsbA family protein [Patescibacteria group bacterium]|nr:DsbA family protein [Patescibacteria group bacterium]MBU1722192.1 DsbA family protein [Patescibacteria group bacterium]MBU1901143.1 DsbA family protein [Patescibacteria group bacterium]
MYNTNNQKTTHIFLSGLSLLALTAFLTFLALFGYYLWIEVMGSPEEKQEIFQQFSTQFREIPENIAYNGESLSTDEVEALIYNNTPVLGIANAPVTIVMFIDFHCPYCIQSYETLKSVQEQYGPVLRVVFKHFPVDALDADATQTAIAAQCAQQSGQFWPYYSKIFESEARDSTTLTAYAHALGIPLDTFQYCIQTEQSKAHILADIEDGVDVEIRGTPTYIVNGQKIEGAITREQWDTLIIQSLKQ